MNSDCDMKKNSQRNDAKKKYKGISLNLLRLHLMVDIEGEFEI